MSYAYLVTFVGSCQFLASYVEIIQNLAGTLATYQQKLIIFADSHVGSWFNLECCSPQWMKSIADHLLYTLPQRI